MSLRDLQRARLKSPSGQVVYFHYLDLESSTEKKAAVFETITGNGTYVQSNGHTSGRLPMECHFSGDNYDLHAEAFLSAILEDGVFVLTHPVYGDVHVVPVGPVTRLDAVKTGAGRVVYTVSFFETTGLQIGDSGGLPQVYDNLLQASAVDFSEKVNLDDPVDKMSFKKRVENFVDEFQSKLKVASNHVGSVNQKIEDAGDSIRRGMDVLLGDPLSLARQIQLMIGEPRRQTTQTSDYFRAYTQLAANIFAGTVAEPKKYCKDAENEFSLNRMTALAVTSTFCMLASESEYLTRGDYISKAVEIEEMVTSFHTWLDDGFDTLAIDDLSPANVDTGDGVPDLNRLASLSAAELLRKSFAAKTEMRETLQQDEAIHPLCFRLYGTAKDETLDFFVASNNLGGDELFLIPKGREVVWYI